MSCNPQLNVRLQLIRETLSLLQEESLILASPADALYFRALAKQKPTIKPYLPEAPIVVPSSAEYSAKIDFAASAKPIEEPKALPPSKEKSKTALPPPSDPPIENAAAPQKNPSPTSWRSDSPAPVSNDTLDFGLLRNLFKTQFSHIPVIEQIPSDAMAKKIATRWKTKNQIAPISVLYFSEDPLQKAFLTEIATAIDVYFGPARLIDASAIEKEKQWETFLESGDLKLVIVCDYTLWQLTDLMRHYKEVPSQQLRTLGKTPLFLLPDLSLYLKDPLLKRSLWKSLCARISS